MPEVWFHNAPMVTGRGSLKHLGRIGAQRVAVVADLRALTANGALTRMEAALEKGGSTWKIVHDARREPRTADLDEARRAVDAFAPDVILGIGGGAAMDVAKALWFFYEQETAGWEQAFVPFGLPPLGKRARLIAVPTTSGTGSETTCVAVFVDAQDRKRLMMSRELIPSLAILDPDLVDSVPPAVAAASGMDALTHAMEAAVCTAAGPMVGAVAEEASACLLEWLPRSVCSEPGSLERTRAREIVHYAASRAGMAINNSSAGLAHAMDQVGPLLGLSHGVACALALPYTIAFLGAQPGYSRIARAAGCTGGDEELVTQLANHVWKLNRALGLPAGYAGCGASEQQFDGFVEGVSKEAACSGSTRLAPVPPGPEEFNRLFWQAFHGRQPFTG
jgi:alcohol dehydrogenase class IV